jgi:hypothetical protein
MDYKLDTLRTIYLGLTKVVENNDLSFESINYFDLAKDKIEFVYFIETEGIILKGYYDKISSIIDNLEGIALIQYLDIAIKQYIENYHNNLFGKSYGIFNEISFYIAKAIKEIDN